MPRGPFDRDAEMALIGAALIDASVLDQVAIDPMAFCAPQLRAIWYAMIDLHAEGKALDELTVAAKANVDDLTLLADCAMKTPTADNAEYYADIVRGHAVTRAVLDAAGEAQHMFRMGKASGNELLDALLTTLTGIDIEAPSTVITPKELCQERYQELDEVMAARQQGEVRLTGLPTGLDGLDELLGGLPLSTVTILCGRPGMGKSSLALGITDHVSAQGHGVHVFSLEDPRSAYTDRMLSRRSLVPAERIRACRLTQDDLWRLRRATTDLSERKNWLYEDVSDLRAEDLVRAVRRQRKRNNTQLVVLDYLQLLRRPKRYDSVHDAITQNIEVLARAAKHDGVAYLVLSQLNRGVEQRQDKRPLASDLRESGSIEERSKCILGMYRGSKYGGEPQPGIDFKKGTPPPTEEDWEHQVDILVLKNSNGEEGFVKAKWDGPTTRVY